MRAIRTSHHQRCAVTAALVPLLLACASVPKVGGQDLAPGDQDPRPETRVRGIEPAVDYTSLAPEADFPRSHQGMEALSGETCVLVLSYAQQRWYDPRTGRFLSEDPVGATDERLATPSRLHAFAYAAGNPLRFTDPLGENPNCTPGDAGCFAEEAEELNEYILKCRQGDPDSCKVVKWNAIATVAPVAVVAAPNAAIVGGLVALGADSTRQGIKQLETGMPGFDYGEAADATAVGTTLGPLGTWAEARWGIAAAGAWFGLRSAHQEAKQGHPATAAFDATLALLPVTHQVASRMPGPPALMSKVGLDVSPAGWTPEGFQVEVPPMPSAPNGPASAPAAGSGFASAMAARAPSNQSLATERNPGQGRTAASDFPRRTLRGVSLRWLNRNRPSGWRQVPTEENKGWIWVDENGTERLRFMRPTGSNPANSQWSRQANGYFRWQDASRNLLDVDGGVVPKSDPRYQELTHIMYEGPP